MLQVNPDLTQRFYEAHPEICFKYLNNGVLLQSKKTTVQGMVERTNLLRFHLSGVEKQLNQNLERIPRSKVKADDMVDALCLGISALIGEQGSTRFIIGERSKDVRAIPMRIAYSLYANS